MKIIFHLDLDSYFVSAERSINPELLNKPVVVSTGGNRSVVTACSYEAKDLGVAVGSPLYAAKQKIHNLVVIKPNFALYVNLSSKVFELISKHFTEDIEVGSIDECYIDANSFIKNYKSIKDAAKAIQNKILKDLRLPCSIGVSTNKFVAKMSTQINKPFGITLTKPEAFLDTFGNWDIRKYHGIGKGLTPLLNAIGIKTIHDLAKANEKDVVEVLGKNAKSYIEKANGNGSDLIDRSMNELKSIGNSITFQDYDRTNEKDLFEIISNLAKMISFRAINRNVVGKVISVSIKQKGNQTIKATSKQKTLTNPIQTYEDIYKETISLFKEHWKGDTLKFVGISLNKLSNIFETSFQMEIGNESKETNEINIIKNINRKFKKRVVFNAKEELLKKNKEKNQTRYIESDRILKHYNKKNN